MQVVIQEYSQPAPFDRGRVARAWQALIERRPADLGCVRPFILESWQRCLDMGMDPHTTRAPSVGPGAALLDLLRENASLLRATAHTWSLMSDTVRASESIFIVTDRRGIELETYGKPELLREAKRQCVGAGYDWSEAAAGTNAVAATLTLKQPTIVRSVEHYCTAAKVWDCAAAPIRDLEDGSLLGLLDVTSIGGLSDSHTLALAVTAAHQIEHSLHALELAHSVQILNWYRNAGSRWSRRAALLLDHKGRVITATDKARTMCASLPANLVLSEGRPQLPADGVLRMEECIPYASDRADALDWEGGILVVSRGKSTVKSDRTAAATPPGVDTPASALMRIAAANPGLADVAVRADRMAASTAPILLSGETGTGKEVFAQAIHASSPAADGPFVAVNCGAITRELAASELLGYEAGAFTGASNKGRRGKFEEADGGTLFLDEIGELPMDIQVQLLRVLQDNIVVRVGSNRERRVDVRVIAATNRELEQEANDGNFRLDLYYRLNVLSLRLPPLREHNKDIPILIRAFLGEMQGRYGLGSKTPSEELMQRLGNHTWPGNVRELHGIIESMYILSRNRVLTTADLPDGFAGGPLVAARQEQALGASLTLDQIERDAIANELKRTGNNLTDTAMNLGISRSTLYRKLERYDIDHH